MPAPLLPLAALANTINKKKHLQLPRPCTGAILYHFCSRLLRPSYADRESGTQTTLATLSPPILSSSDVTFSSRRRFATKDNFMLGETQTLSPRLKVFLAILKHAMKHTHTHTLRHTKKNNKSQKILKMHDDQNQHNITPNFENSRRPSTPQQTANEAKLEA